MKMHILICNERFLFRFGLDRALIMLGKGLKESGHTLSIMANTYDRDVLGTFASLIIDVPVTEDDYLYSNEFTKDWLNRSWNTLFNGSDTPDVVVIGGWPFISAIPFFTKMGIPVVFFDGGAVPLEGYSNGSLIVQKKLRELRKKYLKDAAAVIAISDFIARTQSNADTDTAIPVYKILLGADHLNLESREKITSYKKSAIINSFDAIKNEGRRCILNLGRWEPGCYKNSEAIFDILRKIIIKSPRSTLFILDDSSRIRIPDDVKRYVCPVGFPDDEELLYLMKNADLGISTSLWEGFNLPVAEMQWLNVPVLAFNTGAHPEVVMHPWYLCDNNDEMAIKAIEILNGHDIDPTIKKRSQERFHSFFTWDRVTIECNRIFQNVHSGEPGNADRELAVLIDVTNATRDPANSGVIRVTRRICRELQKYVPVLFVIWDQNTNQYVFPTKPEFDQLSLFNGPVLTDESKLSSDANTLQLIDHLETIAESRKVLIFTETVDEAYAKDARHFARSHHISLAAIFYDAIPVLYPDFCKDPRVKNNHSHYMTGLAKCDLIIPISEYSSECLQNFWRDHNIKGCTVRCNLLPGEFGGYERTKTVQTIKSDTINILCVSTLEPRKNHRTLIDACLVMQEEHPEVEWTLTLVGNRYAGAFEIADDIQKISKDNPCIRWRGVVSDDTLHLLYEEATFTVYPSIVEGFGMPILESICHGKPVICSNQGVMSELAAKGGCLTTDILDERLLANAIYQLCTDKKVLSTLSQAAVDRKLKTWDEYTQQFLTLLKSQNISEVNSKRINKELSFRDHRTWEEILYPNCLRDHWQMNNSEKMALTAILSRHIPRCSIEIGTYKGGSLSLLSQFSNMIFSIDPDPTVSEQCGFFNNVTFLTGLSKDSLPLLLKSLEYEQVPVDFILLDGDHSAEGVKNDLNIVLSYIPQKPLFVMMHDSFNPECRRGILNADWNKCPYVQWVDLDFVPGCVIENGSTSDGEMWGGLALAYLTPTMRNGPLIIERSADKMYELIKINSKGTGE